MKIFISILAILLMNSSYSTAQVKFIPKIFENGFKYPYAFTTDKNIEDTLNSQIYSRISDLEASDFCIGDYGYVQKGDHLQLHMMCTCIDLDESEHRYLFFDLKTGLIVPQAELFSSKEREKALAYIVSELEKHNPSTEPCSEAFSSLPEKITFNDIDIRIGKNGIEVRPLNYKDCEKEALNIEWKNLHSYLQYTFI